jgi:hypothetical protein
MYTSLLFEFLFANVRGEEKSDMQLHENPCREESTYTDSSAKAGKVLEGVDVQNCSEIYDRLQPFADGENSHKTPKSLNRGKQ